jgi:hypothetical protein
VEIDPHKPVIPPAQRRADRHHSPAQEKGRDLISPQRVVIAILGVTVVIQPIEVSARFREIDVPVMLGASVLLLALLFSTRAIGRVWGAVMLMIYAAYMVFLFTSGASS